MGFNHVLNLTPIDYPNDVTVAKIDVASNGFRFRISPGIIMCQNVRFITLSQGQLVLKCSESIK